MNDDFFSDEDNIISDSESDDFLSYSEENFNNNNAGGRGPKLSSEFDSQLKNNQIETLLSLRACLRENKALRKRLVVVEGELEKFQGYRAPNVILPLRDQSTSTMEQALIMIPPSIEPTSRIASSPVPARKLSSPCVKSPGPFKSTTDKGVQVKLESVPPTPEIRIVKETVYVKEIIDPSESTRVIERNDEASQTDDDFTDKIRIVELTRQIDSINKKLNEERAEFSKRLNEKEAEIGDLKSGISDLNRQRDVSNEKLNEANKTILKLTDEAQKLDALRTNEMMLRVENGQLVRECAERQRLLNEANEKFVELGETHGQTLAVVERQRERIEKLEEDVQNESNAAAAKLEVLAVEIKEARASASVQEAENRRLKELIDEMNKHIERYKQDLKNFNFKEFVTMKRELNALRQEKERHFVNIAAQNNNNAAAAAQATPPLPPIKPTKNNIFNFFN